MSSSHCELIFGPGFHQLRRTSKTAWRLVLTSRQEAEPGARPASRGSVERVRGPQTRSEDIRARKGNTGKRKKFLFPVFVLQSTLGRESWCRKAMNSPRYPACIRRQRKPAGPRAWGGTLRRRVGLRNAAFEAGAADLCRFMYSEAFHSRHSLIIARLHDPLPWGDGVRGSV